MSWIKKDSAAKTIEQAIKDERQERREQGGTFFNNKAEDESNAQSDGRRWETDVDAPRIGSPEHRAEQIEHNATAQDPWRTTFDAGGNPTSRAKVGEANLANRRGAYDGDLRDVFSTHRAERSMHPAEIAKRESARAAKAKEQNERAWRGFSYLQSLLSR
ncbi:MAG TPA: hypothetical protein VJU59_09110 [Paraburkholderia sp.]|uniref:hypothetical protein n=1 Tax=Paraburkholderia sp. TaxID=1926495 RepID=UPI002B499162|nr:hypothetical protein [Paraburkholderia sp.]HKR39823.1 hypothetical protein [Paraburkholderia sp.]